MKIVSIVFQLVFVFIITESAKSIDKCDTCIKLVNTFISNLDKTSKGNFGGGNTDWEDKKLGVYLYSETRFEEILEGICGDEGVECHRIIEEYEDFLFDWFKTKQKLIKTQLYDALCVDTIKICCAKDSFGSHCIKCPFYLDRICSGNGICDGAGTRKGDGSCKCNLGSTGKMCEICEDGYYQNGETLKCMQCHKSCKSKCLNSSDAHACVDCKDGWLHSNGKCEDINECLMSPCSNDEYCVNNEGSYTCNKCDDACDGCTKSGSSNCVQCKSGYEMNELLKECVDINECERDVTICGENEPCENTNGSYKCKGIQQDINNKENYYSFLTYLITCLLVSILTGFYLKKLYFY